MSNLPPQELAYQQAHIHEDRGPIVIGVCASLFILSTSAVILRVVARRRKKVKLAWDDYSIFLAEFLLIGLTIEAIAMVCYGLGQHDIAITPFKKLIIGKLVIAFVVNYSLLLFAIKISTLMLYRRLFTVGSKSFWISWWMNLIYVSCYAIAFFAVLPVLFKPADCASSPHPNSCSKRQEIADIALAVFNGLGDLFILSLPVPVVWSMQLRLRSKIVVCGIFMLGSLVVVISFVRIYSLKVSTEPRTEYDANYAKVTAYVWTFAEPAVGVICACLPVLRPIFVRPRDETHGKSLLPRRPGCDLKEWERMREADIETGNGSISQAILV